MCFEQMFTFKSLFSHENIENVNRYYVLAVMRCLLRNFAYKHHNYRPTAFSNLARYIFLFSL
jgi:hypothetical protein